jgi:hypothetical protein
MTLRFHGALIEGKVARAMGRVAPESDLVEALVKAADARDLLVSETDATTTEFATLRTHLADRLDAIVDGALSAVTLPEDQDRRIRRGGKKLVDELDRFAKRLERVAATADAERLRAAETIWNTLYPDGSAQERRWSVLHFISKYGRDWIDELIGEIEREPETIAHRWIYFKD